ASRKPGGHKRLKVREQPAPGRGNQVEALGTKPTPVGFKAVTSGLDQGIVDGEENPLPRIDSMKLYEVQDYISLTGHTYNPAVVLMNKGTWDGLDEGQQAVIEEAIEETTN